MISLIARSIAWFVPGIMNPNWAVFIVGSPKTIDSLSIGVESVVVVC